ncbi:APC family permease [Spiroplasma monobiae]|uniref:Transmembrane protein n=1 Tax=Spiroplasma monobiae MQ-1 TaxID=1336748 RepID=A0A2K9LV10_SPISQ|nr:APC family permease [Spiroplasma monobiae]AUM62860.1 hypothetical protein SMONO_v1c06110 [Spiroplasma monobiae MQ-1]
MKKSIFFGVLLWLSTLILSLLGIFLISGSTFAILPFQNDFEHLNIMQIIALVCLPLLTILGVSAFSTRNGKVLPSLYTVVTLLLIANNIIYVINLMQIDNTQTNIDLSNLRLNLILISIGMLTAVLTTIPMFMLSKTSQSTAVKRKNTSVSPPSEPFKPMVLRENPSEIPEFNSEFTSTPNEETFNISDKLAQLKNDINNNNFTYSDELNEDTLSYDKTQEELTKTHVIDWGDETQTQTSENFNFDEFEPLSANEEQNQNNSFNEPVEPVMPNVAPINNIPKLDELPPIREPKDPYKQTIVPRRSAQRAGEFDQPIGNVVKPTYVDRIERKTPKVDENYQGKVFLGDSDRIWEAMKKQERRLAPKAPKTDHLVSKSNIVNSLQSEKTKTMEIDIDSIFDPVNDQNDENFTPTIDWDD